MSRIALILLLALAVLAVAWGFSHMAPPAADTPSVPRAQAARASAARASGRGPSPEPSAARSTSAPSTADGVSTGDAAAAASGSPRTPAPLRDLFVYADDRAFTPASAVGGAPVFTPAAPVALPTPEPTPTPRPVRLVGFVRQAGRLRAALQVHGDVVVAAAGERAGDYTILTLEEDAGVRLREPDGAVFTLRPDR